MRRFGVVLLLITGLSACGGGDSAPAPAPIQETNTAPTISGPGALSLLEGGTSVATISASDAQNNSLSFSITSGDDNALFAISVGGALSFTAAPDFEAPADSDTDNAYDVTVQVSDGSLTDTQALTITVTDAFEGRVVDAPIAGASVFVDLNGNNEQDEDEPSGVTDDAGFFNVDTFTPPEGVAVKVISKGGTDTKTGKALPDLALISDVPADITKPANVTPLTTVVASVDTPEAKAQVLQAMGINKTPEELLTTDIWAAAEGGDETAKAAQRVNQQVGLLLQTAATVADDGDGATDISVSLAKSVAAEISTAAASDAGIDLTSEATLTTVLASAVAEVAPEVVVEASAIAAVAQSVATVNLVVADPTLDPLSDLATDIVQSAQEELQTSVADVVSGEVSVADFETATDTTQLFADVVVAVDALDTDGDGTADVLDRDDDGDGVADAKDAFSIDASETLDTDGDGIGNNADTDDDGDSVLDTLDAFPLDKTESIDTDADGIGNNADTDADADGVLDTADAFPLDRGETLDTDGDGIGNNADTDDDADGVLDTADVFPLDKTEALDSDRDGIGNTADTDDDGDGVTDASDGFPLISISGATDTDGDGRPNDCDRTCEATGMSADDDDDGDGVTDRSDAFPLDKTETLDTDSDGIGNNTDADDDGDGVADGSDACPLDSRETLDTDSDGICNNTDDDDDGDGVADGSDIFPLDASETLDTDRDGIGNNADPDDDNDGVADGSDDYPLNSDVHTAPTTTSQSLSLNLLPKTTNAKTGTLTSTSQDSRRVTYTIVSNGSLGTATLTDSAGAFSYSTTSTASGNDSFTYKVNDGYVDSTASTISIGIKTDPLYKYQWHLNNTGQTNFTNNSGTTGADLNVDAVIAPSDGRIASVTGQGVTIAIVDSGMEITHEDLVDNVVANGSWNFSNSSNDPTPSWSGSDHGTMVASIAAASGWNDKGIRGVAPDSSLKAFNLVISGTTTADELNALGGFALASDVSIFNMSYGAPSTTLTTPTDAYLAQIQSGATTFRSGKGASYVNAAGNDYYTGATGTSNFSYCGNGVNAGNLKISCYDTIFDNAFVSSYMIGAAALNADGVKASYSTAGSTNWVSAYGGEYGYHTDYGASGRPLTDPAIIAADRSSCAKGKNSSVSDEGNNNGIRANAFNDYQSPHSENPSCNYTNIMNGTSSAAPMVSGVIALMLEANSALTSRDVKHILATTATQADASFSATAVNGINYVGWVTNKARPGLKFHPWYGFGAIDANAAVSAARAYTAGSLGTQTFTSWNNSTEGSESLGEGTLKEYALLERGNGTIEHTNVALRINHAAPNHLGFRLESPAGTVSTLLPPLTGLSTALSSSAWVYLPTNAFYGEDKQGEWKLYIYDHFAGTSGTIVQWGMQFGHH